MPLLRPLIFILLSVLLPTHTSAGTLELNPLTLFSSDDPIVLGRGGVQSTLDEGKIQDLHHPADLSQMEHGVLILDGEYEDVIRIHSGDWRGSRINDRGLSVTGIFPIEFKGKKQLLTLAIAYEQDRFSALVQNSSNEISGKSDQRINHWTLAIGFQPWRWLRLGAGGEQDTESHFRDQFYEISIRPTETTSLSYRTFERAFFLDVLFQTPDTVATLPIRYSEKVQEFSLRQSLFNRINIQYDLNGNDPSEHRAGIKLQIYPSVTINYREAQKELLHQQSLLLDGRNGGLNHGDGTYRRRSGGLTLQRSPSTTYFVNIQRMVLESEGGGRLESDTVFGFWESLVLGDRLYTYQLGAKTWQYHAGVEKKRSDRWTFRGGIQYIDIHPTAILDHWMPSPIFFIGRLDEEILETPYSRIILGMMAGGITYRRNNLEIHYGIGQYFPISLKRTGSQQGGTEGRQGFHFSLNDIEKWIDKISHYPGGSRQMIEIRWWF